MSCSHLTPAEGSRLVNRLKNTNLEKFHTLCKMHLSFLLHLPGASLEETLGCGATSWTPNSAATATGNPGVGNSADKKLHFHRHRLGKRRHNKENKSPDPIGIKKGTIERVLPLVEYLELETNLCQEGLFRKNGHIGRQKLLREKLTAGEDVRLDLEKAVYSAHDCANVLKTTLSDLPEPLMTDKLYPAYCQLALMEPGKQLQTVQLLLQLLPAENLFLLRALLSLLSEASRQTTNKMTSETLGTLFAPHLLVPRKMSASELQARAGNLTKTVAFMIDNVPEIFKVPDVLLCDIAAYWSQMEDLTETDSVITSVPGTPETPRIRYQRRVDPSDIPINTSISFADRAASQEAAEKMDTRMELLQLYTHVASMPDSSKKRKLVKQFNKSNDIALIANSPNPMFNRHKRTKSVGDSIKKLAGRSQKHSGHVLDDSHHSYKVQQTPVTSHHQNSRPNKLFGDEQPQPQQLKSKKSAVHIVDMKENVRPDQLLDSHKRKSPFSECTNGPDAITCSHSIFLSQVKQVKPVDRTPLDCDAKQRVLTLNHTRLTV